MFPTKRDFDEALKIAEMCDGTLTDEVKTAVAQDFARELFDEFDMMQEDERQEIIDMIIDDMKVNFYNIH